jgi:ubiquinone/menaquinone biosynthesis C-methylase UbiE
MTAHVATECSDEWNPAWNKLPGHWVLARLGKRVLRPGGRKLTHRLLELLAIGPADEVVEFAPGLGESARATVARNPRSYTAVERDAGAAYIVAGYLSESNQQCIIASAEATGLPADSASVLYGEAMLSMQPESTKARILHEASRILRRGGRYGMHELCLVPNDLDQSTRDQIAHDLSGEIHVGVRPLTADEWRALLTSESFVVQAEELAPMRLLEPTRILRDEGWLRAIRFLWNVLCNRSARRRVLEMRRVFRKHRAHLAAIVLVAVKN